MRLRSLLVLVAASSTAAPTASVGQATDPTITFTVPLSLTNLPADITKIAIHCRIQSAALLTRNNEVSTQVEFFITNGQVVSNTYQAVRTATVPVIAINLDNATGKQATYECLLSGFSASLQRWDAFSATHAVPAFRLTPTPAPLTGTFVW